jgi:putative SOS response-associated peptidase YedK
MNAAERPFAIETIAERGRAVTIMRRHPDTGLPVPGDLVWGLIPHSALTRPHIQPTQARADTISELAMFRDAYQKRRCILPVDSFQQKDAKGKRHTICRADGEPMAIAGIWENWQNPETGQWQRTFATVTVASNATLAAVHDRMPLVLAKEDIARWLSAEENPGDLLKPCADDVLVVNPGRRVRR